jgi:hypothetical protein
MDGSKKHVAFDDNDDEAAQNEPIPAIEIEEQDEEEEVEQTVSEIHFFKDKISLNILDKRRFNRRI